MKTHQPHGYTVLKTADRFRSAIQNVLDSWKVFITLPLSRKKGYPFGNKAGYEGPEGRDDMKETFQLVPGYNNLSWVALPVIQEKNFFSASKELFRVVTPVVEKILAQMGFSPEDISTITSEKDRWILRCLHYPSRNIGKDADQDLLAVAHPDKAGLTVHLAEDMPGLEVLWKGFWKPVHTDPGYVIAYPGLALQYYTEGNLKGLCHRVRADSEIEKRARHSVVLFVDFGTVSYDKENHKNTQTAFPAGENYEMPFEEFQKYFVTEYRTD